MKKIINGKRYDTETAKEVGHDSYSNPSDFDYWDETLYRKTTGEFFLYGEGGAKTRYAKTVGQNWWSGGSMIIPLTIEKAKEWAEAHLDGDEYEEIFGEVDESGEKKVISLSLPEGVIELIKRGAAESNISMSDYVAKTILEQR